VSVATLCLAAAVLLLALTLVYVYRMAVGPSVFDRIIGLNGFGTKKTVVLLLIGGAFERLEMFIDISLGYALLSFVGTLAAARYFEGAGESR
jgi:multicomponent Na+:H+ antiporter subunit F